MQICKVFLAILVMFVAACNDPGLSGLPESSRQAKKLNDEARAERQRVASQYLVQQLDDVSIASAADMAAALDIPAGLITDAKLTSPHPEAALTLPTFGVIKPRHGNSLVVMSTGRININHLPEPGTDFAPDGVGNDAVTLRITVRVPVGANRMSFDYNFLSSESPDYVGSENNDVFTARVTDALGTRVAATASVNSSFFFDASETRAGGTGFELLFADDPAGVDLFPDSSPPGIPLFADSGMTDFKTANVGVASGGVVTLEFDIRDLGDGILDSTVVVDNIKFSAIAVVDPNTMSTDPEPSLIDPVLGTVVTNPAQLAVNGKDVEAVAADGVTQLLLRVKLPGPGQMKFSLLGENAPADGGVGAVGDVAQGGSVTVNAQQARPGEYYAFALYKSPEDFDTTGNFANQKKRVVSIVAQYIPTSGGGFVAQKDITIVRPPVVVVHDIWASHLYWPTHAGIYKTGLFDVTSADYSSENSLDSTANRHAVPAAVNEALVEMRGKGIAVTQTDVIAHGAGGLLVRKFADDLNYRRPTNFKAGDINRLITMNTPHVGTRLADEIVVMRDHLMANNAKDKQWNLTRDSLFGMKIHIGNDADADGHSDGAVAIDDLKTNSAFINSIGRTQIPSHVMVSRGGLGLNRTAQAIPMLEGGVKVLYSNMEGKHPDVATLSVLEKHKLIFGKTSKLFCADEHDLFAAEADQKGGIADSAISYFALNPAVRDTEHFKVPSDPSHTDRLVHLLNSKVNGGLFASFIPSPRDVPRLNSCKGESIASSSSPSNTSRTAQRPTRANRQRQPALASEQSLSQSSLRIVSPSVGTPVTPGSNVTVVVEASDGFQPMVLFVTGAGNAVFFGETPPFKAQFSIPAQAIGTVELVAYGIDEQGEMLRSNSVDLPLVSSAKLTSIEVLNGDAVLQGFGSTRRLLVLGNYDDGVTRDISSPQLGTVYSSSNTSIATVTSDGMVTGTGPGTTTITVRNGTTFTSINVTVSEKEKVENPCIEVRLGDYNLFVLEDYLQGHYVDGRVAAGGNISLQDFSVGSSLPATETANVLVAGGNITLSNGGVWGDVWYGGQYISDSSVSLVRGTAAHGVPIDFAARGVALRTLSSSLASLAANGTTTLESSWGGVLLRGTATDVNVFDVDATAFSGATLLYIEAPAGSLAVINVRGTSATFSNFGQDLSGGIDEQGVLFNFPSATSLTASGYGFLGTVLAPHAHVTFQEGSWHGGLYARSLTGNGSGYNSRLHDTDICR